VVVKLLYKVVNYQVIKLLDSSWRSFCLPVDSYPFTYWTGTVCLLITTVLLKWNRPTYMMIHDNAVRQVDNETIVVCPQTRTLFVG